MSRCQISAAHPTKNGRPVDACGVGRNAGTSLSGVQGMVKADSMKRPELTSLAWAKGRDGSRNTASASALSSMKRSASRGRDRGASTWPKTDETLYEAFHTTLS